MKNLTRLLAAILLLSGVAHTAAAQYAPDTTVYVDALWFRVHAGDCPELILKEHKPTMTLEEADRAGARIGESGQSGRDDCCLVGYQRKYPPAEIEEDHMGVLQIMKSDRTKFHVHGCHRFTPRREMVRDTLANARREDGFYLCIHCEERGPGYAEMSDEAWAALPSGISWAAPAGWSPSPFATDALPPQAEVNILLSQTLHGNLGIQERVFINPVATVENFMTMRFFFPVHRWLELYMAYRTTGDKRVLEQLRGSARHYNTLSKNYLSAARKQARDPEGIAYMYTMAASARITLQLALKDPSQVTAGQIMEAEDFLTTIISVLQPVCEGNDNLDPRMGIPQPLADDFRSRAFNRALNGIGTIGTAVAALEDLQVLNGTTAYQSTIDRYRKVVEEYIKNWKNTGFQETYEGEDYFSYPYSATDNGYMVGNVKMFGADDQGHFSHSMQGCYLLFESVPELGVDDAFMTAIANTIHFNSLTKTSGSPQTPSQEAIQPKSRKPYGSAIERFYMLEAFKDGLIDAQSVTLSASRKESENSEYGKRLATLNALYLKALRQDPDLIYLGEELEASADLSEALGLGSGDATTGGDAPWLVVAGQPRSGAISDNQASWVEAEFVGPGVLSFDWKVSSEFNFDSLEVYVDGEQRERISGEVDWQEGLVALATGRQTVRWSYLKDGSRTVGVDAGWLRNIQFTEGAPELIVEQTSFRHDSTAAENQQIGLSSNVAWTASRGYASWITLGTSSGVNDGTITYAISANASLDPREGTITVSGGGLTQLVFVEQAGSIGTPGPGTGPGPGPGPSDTWYNGAEDLGGDWRWLPWLRSFNISQDPWIFHPQHGWLYPFGDEPASAIYFWDFRQQAFVYTTSALYPTMYRFSDNTWVRYQIGSNNPRWFVDLLTGIWEQVD